ncbi:hypothetical protein E2556_01460 [Staphylococcus croceilyticus]|uniref:Uncharacterized protein n=1 Tax=Staphylococcus croceilyticus TaxID=319942 RepID=A0ABY2KG55_9STAP|nr:hypothetical protein [Staphylococcus croceilyticus]PNZ69483.1 hypothetical protein CD128_04800 [Staphylococcus croceilyticus]TGA81011.1 hypothetical protein E2556_01460 [Staphylococcus croceilyticus]
MNSNKPKIAQKRWFNIMLIFVGILSFSIFYFGMHLPFMLAFLYLWAPVLIGFINLKEINSKNIDERNNTR